MHKIIIFNIAMFVSTMAIAETATKTEHKNFSWFISTGLGYDSNAYHAPRAPYVNYAFLPKGTNPIIPSEKESGLFIPVEIKVETVKNHDQDIRLLGSVVATGYFYTQEQLKNANEHNVRVHAGYEFVLAREKKSENTFYVGTLLGKHKQVYVDHDTGLNKTTSKLTDISNRYSYVNMGVEAKYKRKIGSIDYGVSSQYIRFDYENPVVVSQLDNSYFKVGGDVSLPIISQIKLDLSYDRAVRDYFYRHTHDELGTYRSAYPLLQYSYNVFGASLRDRISPEWLLHLDYVRTLRTDAYVGYNDYTENKFGLRLLYEQGAFKTKLTLHHWERDYPNGFAFDVAGQGAKTYSGNDLKVKAELKLDKNISLWSELINKVQSTTDLRYDFEGRQIMAGMSWSD